MLMALRPGGLSVDQLAPHKDKTWSKFSGWAQFLKTIVSTRSVKPFSRVWLPLFILSFLSWAFLLTGLTMNTQDSFKPGKRSRLNVVGANHTNFNLRSATRVLDADFHDWGQTQEAYVPGNAAVYFTPGEPSHFNMTTGNKLPSKTEKPIFIAPQAEFPVTGQAWGIMLQYQCKPVTRSADFQILNRRINSSTPGYIMGHEYKNTSSDDYVGWFSSDLPPHIFYEVPGHSPATISLLPPKSLDSYGSIFLIAEVGLSNGLSSLQDNSNGYASPVSHGIHDEDVLEIALWQFQPDLLGGNPNVDINNVTWYEETIPELKGEHLLEVATNYTLPLHAIGVQCTSSSQAGTARLDGIAGTFQDFHPKDTDPDFNGSLFLGIPRFSKAVPAMFLPGIRASYVEGRMERDMLRGDPDYEWLPKTSDFDYYRIPVTSEFHSTYNYTSIDWRSALIEASDLPVNLSEGSDREFTMYLRPIRPTDLQHAMEEAHKLVAASLMYHQLSTPGKAWENTDLVACEPWTSLVLGSIPPLLVVVALVLWALGRVVLESMYGFTKRWDSYFSVKSMYWYCVKIAHVDPAEVMRA